MSIKKQTNKQQQFNKNTLNHFVEYVTNSILTLIESNYITILNFVKILIVTGLLTDKW